MRRCTLAHIALVFADYKQRQLHFCSSMVDMISEFYNSSRLMSNRFFRPKMLSQIGTFQDGGLHHNNPLNIALWEVKHVWPAKSSPDFVLSIGTGVSASLMSTFTVGPQSPVKDGFLTRVFKTFMRSLDGEKIWHDTYNSLPETERKRYHRLNLTLEGTEPAIDDLNSMYDLRDKTKEFSQPMQVLKPVLDSIYASMFYFEFGEQPVPRGHGYFCSGAIFCRLRLPEQARMALMTKLKATSSYFLICGQPVSCVERLTKSAPLYKRSITFMVGSLDEPVRITLRGITSQPVAISGLPRSANEIVQAQKLVAPFGRTDHSQLEKTLPLLPAKRKFTECETTFTKIPKR